MNRDIIRIEFACDGKREHLAGIEKVVLGDLFSLIPPYDPNVVLCPNADTWMPRIVRKMKSMVSRFT